MTPLKRINPMPEINADRETGAAKNFRQLGRLTQSTIPANTGTK
jgi:hypothetical protein